MLEPRNPFARRTLAQLLLMEDETAAALPHLRAAAEVAADDPINLFTYAQALLARDGDSHVAEADALFKQALRLAPVGELAERIKNQQRKLAGRVMRANAQGMPRMDAVEYLISALQAYQAMKPEGPGDQRPHPEAHAQPLPRRQHRLGPGGCLRLLRRREAPPAGAGPGP